MTIQEKASALINRCEFGLFGNNDEQGNPQIKAMIKTKNEGLKTFWFCTNTSSKRVNQIKNDGNTGLYFYNGYEGVMLRGFAEVSYDDDIRKSFWQDDMVMYYPLGHLDPDFALIKFTAMGGNHYKDLHNEDFGIE
jgi:general stress protein 26